MLRVEGRRGFTAPLRPCRSVDGADRCGSNSLEDRDGDGMLDGTAQEGGGAGGAGAQRMLVEPASRAATSLETTRLDYRYRGRARAGQIPGRRPGPMSVRRWARRDPWETGRLSAIRLA